MVGLIFCLLTQVSNSGSHGPFDSIMQKNYLGRNKISSRRQDEKRLIVQEPKSVATLENTFALPK